MARVGRGVEPGGPGPALDDPGDGVAGQAPAEAAVAGLSQTQVQAADGAARPCFHALFATGSPKQQASR